ncbi:hypothetical protein [Olsenella sp. HMSC062G07]|uniref:hypothetical protein n=1 Tax=Olsenella sp. HMSC062G07 TaxID=1739330 RepID=UPI0008A52DDF|nr:hypothetical protein [Olsenella sp. HMSC062G07]OFK23399.1 hypothetical protein HMPREF2826_04770 [Olsenella sp. HMSC062G07]
MSDSRAGLRCADCVFAQFVVNEMNGMYQGICSRGYTLADPHVRTSPDCYFVEDPRLLVPVIDPFGKEFLRTKNICERFLPQPKGGDGHSA